MRTNRRSGLALGAAVLCTALVIAACGGGSHKGSTAQAHVRTSTTAAAAAPKFRATLKAPDHSPRANKPWPITVTARTNQGKALSGMVSYQFLFSGQVVSRQPGGKFKRGVFKDQLEFPSRSVGYPLTLRVVVKTKLGTRNIDWTVKVRR